MAERAVIDRREKYPPPLAAFKHEPTARAAERDNRPEAERIVAHIEGEVLLGREDQ